jgi:anti-sigma regulatory factor (Ser/Thr protein kinase)
VGLIADPQFHQNGQLLLQQTGTTAWPLQTRLPLAALPTAPGVARGHVRAVLHEWGLEGLADTAEILVSELVTNAVQACDRLKHRADLAIVPVIGLWLISDQLSVIIHVEDPCDEMPVRKDTAPDEESGRGLMLVEVLSKDHGVYRKAEGTKVVWALLTSADP